MRVTGKATYVDLAGGFYGIVADDGTQYHAINMPQQYCSEGAPVRCTLEIIQNAASISMWGQPARIRSFET